MTGKSSSMWSSLSDAWKSEDAIQQRLLFTCSFVIAFAALLIGYYPHGYLGLMGTPLCTLWAILVAIFGTRVIHLNQTKITTTGQGSKVILFFLLGFSPLIFFEGVNIVSRARYAQYGRGMLHDNLFLALDELLLGWLFPRGQLALYLDNPDSFIGTQSLLGRFITEVLQTMYVSYYIWGNGLLLFLAYLYFRKKSFVPEGSESLSHTHQWRRLQLVVCTWVCTFLLNLLLNLLIPAVSPRIFIADEYKTELRGLFLAGALRSAAGAAAANSFTAFPSGHCGLSWITVVIAGAIGFRKYARITYIAGALITLATVWLRYHYFVDVVAAIVLLKWGVFIGYMDSPERFRAAIYQQVSPPSGHGYASTTPMSPMSSVSPSSEQHTDDFTDAEGLAAAVGNV